MGYKTIVKRTCLTLALTMACIYAFAQKPNITGINKRSAGNQDIVTLQGSSFGSNTADLSVFFGASKATINFVSDQLLEVKVPSGTTYDNIAVTHIPSGLTDYTSEKFLLSFGGLHGFAPAKLEGQKDFAAETGLYDLCLCDFDGNGKTDIVTANDNSNSITILENTSTGTGIANISFSKILPNSLLNARSLHTTCGDLNGDGRPDLVISEGGSTGDRIFIFQNTSSGPGNLTFTIQSIKLIGKKVKRVKIGDLDRDGKPELVVTNQSANNITILVNQSTVSTITFSTSPITISIPGAASTDGLDINDIDGDGLSDIIISQFLTATSNLFILRNKSTLGNVSLAIPVVIPIGGTIVNVKSADLDNDQKPDIVVTQLLASSISIFRNQSSPGTITLSSPTPITTEDRPWGLDFGDLDGDSKPDIVVASLTKKSLTILNNESTVGNLSFQTTIKTTTFINRHTLIGDIDGDAKPDVAFTSVDDNNNSILASKVSILRNTVCLKPVVSPAGPHTVCVGFPLKLTTAISPGTTFEWKDGAAVVASGPNAFFDVTVSGNYTVSAIAEGGACTQVSNIVAVTVEPGTTTGTAVPINNGPICIGSTLVLGVNDVGGTEYKWTGPNGYTGTTVNPANVSNFQSVNAGRYSLDVIVGTCVAQKVSTVVESVAVPDFQINAGGSSVVCPPSTKSLSVSPNLPSFTYQWFERTSGIIAGETSTTYNATTSGEYYVQAKYSVNPSCATVETTGTPITFASAPIADFTIPATACMGQNITFTNSSTTDPGVTANYAWDFGDGSISTELSPVKKYLAASTFTAKLTTSYSNGACTNTKTKNISIQAAPVAAITTPEGEFSICPGESLKLEVLGSFTSYSWNTSESTAFIIVEEAGTYTVDVTTTTGCTINASKEIIVFDPATVTATATPQEIPEGGATELLVTGLDVYTWEPGETLSNVNIPNPTASPLITTTYTVKGNDVNGCPGEASIEVSVKEGSIYSKIKPSPFFSPDNGDEMGKFWTVEKIEEYPGCQITIYDDKGVKVHEAKPYLNTWDGTSNGRKLPDGVYYFIIKCVGEQNSPKTGSITLLR